MGEFLAYSPECMEGEFSEVGLFRVEEVECYGQRRCEPSSHLERLTRPGVLRGLVHRGGLRADVLSRAVGSEPATASRRCRRVTCRSPSNRSVVLNQLGIHSTSLRRIALKPNHTTVKAVGVPIARGIMPPGLSLVCGLTVR
jgi:hypothetical protein